MTLDDLAASFKRHEEEYIKFERIESPRVNRPDLCAFLMLHALVPVAPGEGQYMVSAAGHDQIWLVTNDEQLAEVVTDEQVRDLVWCGVMYDEAMGLSMFV